MFERLEARVRAVAQARVRRRVEALGAAELPAGVRLEADGDRLVLSGRKLRRRMVADAMLRWWRA